MVLPKGKEISRMEIITNAENRKELVKALAEHFGQRSEYLGPPSFAYRIGSITVDRDAKVILEDDSMEDEVRRVRLLLNWQKRILHSVHIQIRKQVRQSSLVWASFTWKLS